MKHGYFHRVAEQTTTRFWINNPTLTEARMAIEAGAVGCTFNPSYCQKMLDHPAGNDFAWRMLDEAVRESDGDSEAQTILQRKLAKPVAELFRPLLRMNRQGDGFVTLQGDPLREHDPQAIIDEAIANRALAGNICIKVPLTQAGLKAIEALVAKDIPVAATEIFAVSQAVALCETYDRVSRSSGRAPAIFLAHIAGIYDDYLKAYAETHRIDIPSDVLWQAGLAVARKVYQIIMKRGYRPVMIGGGARGTHHFTEMVGGDVVVTINWLGTADKLIEQDPPVVHRLLNPVPQSVIDQLIAKLPDFRRGYLDGGLEAGEFHNFGPVELFRGSFIGSWKRVLGLIAQRRACLAPKGRPPAREAGIRRE